MRICKKCGTDRNVLNGYCTTCELAGRQWQKEWEDLQKLRCSPEEEAARRADIKQWIDGGMKLRG